MKKLAIALFATTALTAAGVSFAQRGGDESPAAQHKRGHHKKGQGLQRILKNLDEIGVSASTQEKIKKEIEGQKPEMKKLRERMKLARETGDPIQMQEARLKMMEKRLELTTDVRKYLTDAQWAQVTAKMKEKHMQRREKRQKRFDDMDLE